MPCMLRQELRPPHALAAAGSTGTMGGNTLDKPPKTKAATTTATTMTNHVHPA